MTVGTRTDGPEPHPVIDYPAGGPEALFHVDELTGTAQSSSGVMEYGPWMRDGHGLVRPGAFGVLIDVAFGHAAFLAGPPDSRASTTETVLEFCRPIPPDAGRMRASGRTVHADARQGVGAGTICAEDGTVLVTGLTRLAFAPGGRPPFPAGTSTRPTPAPPIGLPGMATRRTPDAAEVRLRVGAQVCNPAHTLHGGISLWLSELAGVLALDDDSVWLPSSLHIVYLRRIPAEVETTFKAEVSHRRGRSAVVRVASGPEDGEVDTYATVVYRRQG
jgi:acyl-coenzyme A thioesterase PaaI-like protein